MKKTAPQKTTRPRLTVIIIFLGIFMSALDASIVSIANPTIAAELGVTEARIRVAGTDEYLMMAPVDGSADSAMPVPTDWYASVVSPYASAEYSFAIELGNWDWQTGTWTMIATSDAVSYTTLKTAGHIAEWDGTDPSAPAVWNPTSYVIPEPSGGMLMLVGLALLALRRRRSGGE